MDNADTELERSDESICDPFRGTGADERIRDKLIYTDFLTPPSEKKLIRRIRQLAIKHPRFGYRRIWALLRREGNKVNVKKMYRLWRLEKLALPKRRPHKKRAEPTLGILPKAEKANQVWTYDACFRSKFIGQEFENADVD